MKRFAALLLLACAVTAQIDLSNKKLLFPLGTDGLNIEAATKRLPQYTLTRDAKNSDRCSTGTSCGSEYLVQSSFTQVLDTGLAITICLCNGHVMGAAEIARKFAHVPAPLRSATNLISSKPTAADSSYSVNNAISLMGVNSINNIIREAAHTFDTANGASNSGRYVTALRKDACVIDGEATLSASEAWSSSVLVWAYFLVSDPNKANDAAYKCWAEQKKAVEFFLPVETTPANFFTNEYEIVPASSKDSALGVGKDLFTITTAGQTKSKWHFIRASGRSFLICETVQHLCLDAYGRTRNGDAPILFGRRNAGINQRWNLAENSGLYTFSNQANRLFLDIASCSRFSNSTNAVMGQESGSTNCQKWTLKEIPKPKPTIPKTHTSSYTETTRKTESFSERPTTHTKTKTATVSTRGTDKVSSSRSVVNTVPQSQSFSVQIQPGKTISASKDVVLTGTTQQVYTGSMMANKTRTATESTKVSTFTKPSKTKSLSRTAGNSFSVSKTRTATN